MAYGVEAEVLDPGPFAHRPHETIAVLEWLTSRMSYSMLLALWCVFSSRLAIYEGTLNIRRIIFYWGLVVAILAIGVTSLLSTTIIQDGFEEIEKRHVLNKTFAAKNALREVLDRLDRLALDWTVWDDAYEYVQNRDEEFEQANLVSSTYVDQQLAAIFFLNQRNQIIYSHAVDSTGAESPQLLSMLQGKVTSFISSASPNSSLRGYFRGGPNLYILVGHPVLKSEGGGPSQGYMLMIQMISEEVIASISASIGNRVAIAPQSLSSALMEGKDDDGGAQIEYISEDEVRGVLSFDTLEREEQGLLTIDLARDITRYGSTVAIYNSTLIVLLLVSSIGALYYVMHRKVLGRLESLKNQVAEVDVTSNDEPLLPVEGRDEISLLGNTVNDLLSRLHKAREEQEAQRLATAESERFLSQILNSISVGILLIDPNSREIVEINDYALRLANRHRDEVVGNICHKLTCPAEQSQCPILDLHQSHDMSQRVLLDRDGKRIPIFKSVSMVKHKGRDLLLETVIDITEMERSRLELEKIKDHLEDLVAERTGELEKVNKDLMNLSKSKDLFLSSASHELRTPLTSILGFLKLMERRFNKHFYGLLSEDASTAGQATRFLENFAIVRAEAERLGRLVNDLLSLDKINSGKMEWRDEYLKVNEVLALASGIYSGHPGDQSDVRLVVESLEEDVIIFADQDKIQQVIVNLMNNAFKFTEKGQVTLSAISVGDGVQFVVSDTGKGIAEKDQEHIFDLFYQISDVNNRSSKHFGTGLGLAICQQIVAHYGSEMLVSSRLGEGTSFSFVLPKS